MDTRIYVCTHKKAEKPSDEIYQFIHAGHQISPDLGYIGDDTKDHISYKNKSFCELTAIYWIYKNISCDIVGICHYRRYFIENENFLCKERIEQLLEKYDIILPNSLMHPNSNTEAWYSERHHAKDLQIIKDIIDEKYPEYSDAFLHSIKCNLFSIGNMLITKKEIFDEYCCWLFDILFEAEKRIDISEYDDYQKRVFGFLSERLTRVWMLQHAYRIYEIEVREIDPATAENAVKKVALTNRIIRLQMDDLVTLYKTGNYMDLAEIPSVWKNSEGVNPVWVCWWQGLEHAPEMVKMCVQSIQKHLPENGELILITLKNIEEYVILPDWIWAAFHDGKISMALLSDILRAELLYLYGGLWIDSTYYITRSLAPVFEYDFFTIKTPFPKYRADIAQNRWTGNFMKISAGSLFMRFLLNGFFYYILKYPDEPDCDLIDHLIFIACKEIPGTEEIISSCPASNPHYLDLTACLNNVRKKNQELADLFPDTFLFKLSYKIELRKENLVGQQTFYGYL